MTATQIFRVFFIMLIAFQAQSQNRQSINFTVEDGLPSSEIYDVIQDKYGYIWLSTDRGISRYNGYEFENFDKSDGLTDNVVFDFLEMPNGDIWGTTITSELFKISGKTPKFTHYKYNSIIKEKSDNLVTNGLYFSPEGDMYMRFHHRVGYLKITASGEVKEVPMMAIAKLKSFHTMVIKDDSSEPFFFNSDGRLRNYPESDSVLNYNLSNILNEAIYFENHKVGIHIVPHEIIVNAIDTTFKIDTGNKRLTGTGKLNDSTFWIGYVNGGVDIYSVDGTKINHYLSNYFVSQIYQDRQNNLWITTLNSGLFLIRKTEVKILVPDFENDLRVNSIEKNDNNEMYVGYYCGNISKINSNRKIEPFRNSICSAPSLIKHDKTNNTTYFNFNNTLFSNKEEFISFADSKFIYLAHGAVYMGSGGVYRIIKKQQDKLFFDRFRIRDFIHFNDRFYGASMSSLLWEKEMKDGSITNGQVLADTRIDVLGLIGDKLIAGSTGHGVFILDKQNKIVSHITKQNGLNSNFVSNIYVENDSTLWVCTNRGVSKISFDKNFNHSISKLDYSDGLLSNEVWDLVVLNDTVWVGTQLGINYFQKDYISSPSHSKENHFLSLKTVFVNNNSIEIQKAQTSLPYYKNKIEFKFEGINFQKGLTYRYQLKGLENKWSYTKNRNVIFSSLPPGDYNLILQSKGSNGQWKSNEVSYSFTILLPFWETWWFLISIALSVIVVVYFFFKYRILSYNREIFREILRQFLKYLKRKQPPYLVIKDQGKEIKLLTSSIQFIKSSGNYLEIYTENKTHLTRLKIGEFLDSVSDPLEFLRIHRSYIIRLDQVQQKTSKTVVIADHEITVGRKYWEVMENINF